MKHVFKRTDNAMHLGIASAIAIMAVMIALFAMIMW
jgi:hypothetical protein